MQLLLLSPYHSGSHQAWAEGYQRHSRHAVHLLTLPGQLWKWRMHGAAVTLAREFTAGSFQPDLIIADDMLDLATFLALTRRRTAGLPVAIYMHENQLTYPLPQDKSTGPMRRNLGLRERQYVLINWKAMLAADRIFFNSRFHWESWFAALPPFLKHYPQYNEMETVESLRAKSAVLPVGIDLEWLDGPESARPRASSDRPPLILWNQRWEFDKNPAGFFKALYTLKAEKRPFRLAICGENFQNEPTIFHEARQRLAGELVHFGYAERDTYRRLLWEADITLSTAYHEFFGISILEAIYCETFPLLPRRLSYPELLPERHHPQCLYESRAGLLARLRWAVNDSQAARAVAQALRPAVAAYGWPAMARRYDETLSKMGHTFQAT